MQGQVHDGFYARFLGGFSLCYRGREVQIGMSLQSKPVQFLLLLLKAGDEGVERKGFLALVQNVGNDQKRQLNNFYQHMHVLRDMIPGMGLPEGRYIILRKGRYYFTADHPVGTDIRDLDGLIGQIRREGLTGAQRRELCLAYCKGYGGEMLPQLAGEGWVTIEGAFYQRWYGRCLEELCASLREEGRHEEMLEMCTTASQLHPYDGWQAKVVEALLALGRYKEAEQAYRQASQLLSDGLGGGPLKEAMAGYRQEAGGAPFGAGSLVGLEQGLSEEEARAPYRCSYPSFQDIYRIVVRQGERQGGRGLLLLCTLRGVPRMAVRQVESLGGGPPEGRGADSGTVGPDRATGSGGTADSTARTMSGSGTADTTAASAARTESSSGTADSAARTEGGAVGRGPTDSVQTDDDRRAAARKALEREMSRLRRVLEDGLRTCDVYTRYSEDQYLALLTGAGTEDGEQIVSRLGRGWRMAGGRAAWLDLEVQPIEDSIEGVGDGEGDVHRTCHQPGELHMAGTGHMAG